MAKRSYMEMTNLILRRINEDDISTTVSMTGKASIIGDIINDGQNMLFAETDWYTLYKERIFQTSDDVVIVVLDYSIYIISWIILYVLYTFMNLNEV